MLHHDLYVRQKLRELEQQQHAPLSRRPRPAPQRRPVIGPAIRGTGRFLRRLGEGIEAMGGYESEPVCLEQQSR